ncbi:MAG: TetR/AcrR family transcriptional regulator [Deltaproteobacteria bacterium]|nr:TetR/AcrR family transcriptional regulator [Deltaproteobacteria bacterium]
MRVTEQAKRETRNSILERAAEFFLARGFEDTTTRDIADAAGLAAGTLFNYFPSKETLAMSMVTEALSRGRADHRRRRTGHEELVEDLFLFVASGLRRLKPMHAFLGPVLERSLSPFPRRSICPEGEAARQAHLAAVREILREHGFAAAAEHVAMTLYWSLYLGILACWSNDASPKQEATRAMIDYALRCFVEVISGTGADAGGTHVR